MIRFQNATKHYSTHQNMSLGPMGWIGCVRCEKFRCDFVARTFALIAQVQPILHRVPCSIKTLPNAPKCYATQQKKSLGSTWLDRVCSLRKIRRRLHGTNLCINCTGSTYFAPSLCSNKRLSNAPKHYEMLQNMSLGSNGVDRVHSFLKISMRLRGKNFCIDYTSSAHFALSFMQ